MCEQGIFVYMHFIGIDTIIYSPILTSFVCLFDIILYIPVNKFYIMSEQFFLGWTSAKQGLMCLAQRHNTVTPVRL